MRRSRVALGVVLAAGAAAAVAIALLSRRDPPSTDPAPIQRRVQLPGELRSVRWRASPIPEAGCLSPGPTDVLVIHAYVELAPPPAPAPGARQLSVELPADVVDILPADQRRTPIVGAEVAVPALLPRVAARAVRLGPGVVVEIRQNLNAE